MGETDRPGGDRHIQLRRVVYDVLHGRAYFTDTGTQAKVLGTSSPKEQKTLGKLVNGFNKEEWSNVKYSVLEEEV